MKSSKTVYFIECILFIYIIMFRNIFSGNIRQYLNIINLSFLGLLLVLSYVLLGFKKKRNILSTYGKQNIIIHFIIYFVAIYVLGLFLGFLENAYVLTFTSITKNLLRGFLFIVLCEFLRYIILSRSSKLSIVIITLLLAFLNIIMEMNAYHFDTITAIFEFIAECVITNIAFSCLLSYISLKFDYKLAILFISIYRLPNYVLPIFPDMGAYIGTIIRLVMIVMCHYSLSTLIERYERKQTKKKKSSYLGLMIIIVLLLAIVGVVSGLFKYHLLAIGSNSMLPYFAKGDAVMVEKLKREELDEIKVGDVIVVHFQKRLIIHRVTSIEKNGNEYYYHTKGDNNESEDGWVSTSDTVYGKVKFVIKYIGLPSIELGEMMNRKE